jgi:hypothetical protein
VSAFQAPVDVPAPPADAFGRCECSHPIYDHGRVNMDGNQVWKGCKRDGCPCTAFKASDGSTWPNVYASAAPADPTDLDVNSDAWVDGQVVLSHEREPDVGGRP